MGSASTCRGLARARPMLQHSFLAPVINPFSRFASPGSRSISHTASSSSSSSSNAPPGDEGMKPEVSTRVPSTPRKPETPRAKDVLSSIYGRPSKAPTSPTTQGNRAAQPQGSMMDLLRNSLGSDKGSRGALAGTNDGDMTSVAPNESDELEPYHFHIYSHKHNTHVTVTKPDRGAIVSMSTGNIGFKKSRRKHYDAAYQLTAYVLERLRFAGWQDKISRIELVLRGFGTGREAGVKVLMSPEGAAWRSKVVRVADSTRLKFGGTRSKNPRRL